MSKRFVKRVKTNVVVMGLVGLMLLGSMTESKAYYGGRNHKHTPNNPLYWNQIDKELKNYRMPTFNRGSGGATIKGNACSWYGNSYLAYKGNVMEEGFDPVLAVKKGNSYASKYQITNTDWGHMNFAVATPIVYPGMHFVKSVNIGEDGLMVDTNHQRVYEKILYYYNQGYGIQLLWRHKDGSKAHYVAVDYLTTDGKVRILDSAYEESYLHKAQNKKGRPFYASELFLFKLDSNKKFKDFEPIHPDYDKDTLIGGTIKRDYDLIPQVDGSVKSKKKEEEKRRKEEQKRKEAEERRRKEEERKEKERIQREKERLKKKEEIKNTLRKKGIDGLDTTDIRGHINKKLKIDF